MAAGDRGRRRCPGRQPHELSAVGSPSPDSPHPAQQCRLEPAASEPEVDLEALLDLASPWCLRVATTLRIADHVAAGHHQIADLAGVAGCHVGALHAVLSHLATKGVFREEAPGWFALNPAAAELRDPGPFLDLDGIGARFADVWGTLLRYVRTGRPAYHERFGRPFWQDLAANPELAADFYLLMRPSGPGDPDYDIELVGGWDRVETVIDVGGGTGAMLAGLLRRHPHVRGVLVDLPGTVARAAVVLGDPAIADRVSIVAQSFFDPLPAGASLYLLKKVLNDWPDDETVAILRRCAEAAIPLGRVVILGGISPDDAPPGLEVETVLFGGRSNTLAEFRQLAHQAGLVVDAAGVQPSGQFVVECRARSAAPSQV